MTWPNSDSAQCHIQIILESEPNCHSEFSDWGPGEALWELQRCIDNHNCNDTQTKDLPTRLLDLEGPDPDYIKLIPTEQISQSTGHPKRIPYAALTYCWGDNNNTLQTTPSKLQQHLSAIQIADLPRTLRENIWVVRDLGLRYLWIDALCIVQREANIIDNEAVDNDKANSEWQHESARMHLVYGNAFLTIVAASASSSDEGLFMHRDPVPRYKFWWNACGLNANTPLHEEPISKRAWVLQEWILSPRLMVFSRFGIQFYCRKFVDPTGAATNSRYWGRFDVWHTLVSDYCSRDAADSRDKLPASSGLAQMYAKKEKLSGKDYLAGLWRNTLLGDLLWFHTGKPSRLPTPKNRGRKTDRAPTWSWASIDGNVEFNFTRPCPDVTIKDCHVELTVSNDFFGQVKSGVLLINCQYMSGVTFIAHSASHRLLVELRESEDSFGIMLDDPDEYTMIEGRGFPELQFLKIGQYNWLSVRREDETYGIVVRFDDEKRAFVRVALFKCTTRDFHTSGKKDFEIV